MNLQAFDLSRALVFMFDEEGWARKFLIASALLLLIFPPFGYVIELIRRVADARPVVLPQWDDWGQYFKEGFSATVALFAYSLPSVCPACFIVLASISMADQSGQLAGGLLLLSCCAFLLSLLLTLPLYAVYSAGLARYADTRQFSAFFQFGALWRQVRLDLGLYGYVLFTILLANIIGGFVPIVGQVWAYLVSGYALGHLLQRWRNGNSGVARASLEEL